MINTSRLFIFTAALIIGSFATLHTLHAKIDDQTEIISVNFEEHIFDRNMYVIELFNNPSVSESKFTMRLSEPGIYSGCAKMIKGKGAKSSVKQVGNKVRIKVRDTEISLDNSKRYSNYDCAIKQNAAFVDIELDRNALIKKKTKSFKISSKRYGDFGKYTIKVSKEKIDIKVPYYDAKTPATPQSLSPEQQSLKKTFTLRFWFFPKNTIMLEAPSTPLGENVIESLIKFGKSRGLKPLGEKFRAYKIPTHANNYVLFTDPRGFVSKQINASKQKQLSLGTIETSRKIYDANGPKEESVPLDVKASMPQQTSM